MSGVDSSSQTQGLGRSEEEKMKLEEQRLMKSFGKKGTVVGNNILCNFTIHQVTSPAKPDPKPSIEAKLVNMNPEMAKKVHEAQKLLDEKEKSKTHSGPAIPFIPAKEEDKKGPGKVPSRCIVNFVQKGNWLHFRCRH